MIGNIIEPESAPNPPMMDKPNAGRAKNGLEPCADREGHGSKHERYAAGDEQPLLFDLAHVIVHPNRIVSRWLISASNSG